MPRHYEKKEGTRRIMYRQDDIARAMTDVQEGMSIRAAATKNNVPHETLRRRLTWKKCVLERPGRCLYIRYQPERYTSRGDSRSA
ncbi:hypothetical protein Avbf_13056 [Armadillidium vulgare]|nr:hypothetical protein Avbf_13056 [Armadillidium vulgare]